MKSKYVVTWEEGPPNDWGSILVDGMNGMFPDMEVKLIKDGWIKKEAKLSTTDRIKEVKCTFYDAFLKHGYKFRNLKIKKVKKFVN